MMFMDLADPRYAYMFGFLQMDGHLSRGAGQKGRLQVEISSRDAEILRAFQELTPYNSTLSERTRTTNFASEHTSTTWNLYSLEARDTLVSLGLPYGRKSRRVTPPRVAFARRDYLRGVIDADGSLGYTGHGFPYLSLTTASTAIATYLCFYGRKVVGAEKLPARNKRDSIYNVLYLKERAVSLVAHLYYPGCLALKRKQQAAQAIQEWVRPPDMAKQEPRRRWRTWEDRFSSPAAIRSRLPQNWAGRKRDADCACGGYGQGESHCLRYWQETGPTDPNRATALFEPRPTPGLRRLLERHTSQR